MFFEKRPTYPGMVVTSKPEVHNTGRQEGEVMSRVVNHHEHRLKLVCRQQALRKEDLGEGEGGQPAAVLKSFSSVKS